MDSKLYLCLGVELDPNYKYTLNFETEAEQLQYFSTKTQSIIDVDGYSYIREEEAVKVDANIDDLFGINYLIYKNKGKEYYAFITHKEYVSESTTKIYFEIDVLQTFMWDYTIDESFIEREHQDRLKLDGSNLSYKFNREKETIDYGEDYLTEQFDPNDNGLIFTYCYLNNALDSTPNAVKPATLFTENNIDTGYGILMTISKYTKKREVERTRIFFGEYEVIDSSTFISKIRDNVNVAQIIVSRIPPVEIIVDEKPDGIHIKPSNTNSLSYGALFDTTTSLNSIVLLSRNYTSSFDYFPKLSLPNEEIISTIPNDISITNLANAKYESKLKQFPYSFIKVMYGGNEFIDKYELQATTFKAYQSLSSEASSAVFPINYLHQVIDESYDPQNVLINQIPNYVDLLTDEWKKYLLQNKNSRLSGFVNDGISAGIGVIGAVGAAATGHPVAALASLAGLGANGFMKISSQLAKEKDIRNQPIDVKQFNGDLSLNITSSNLNPIFLKYDIPNYIKYRLFKYFMHYGYACNSFKKPNINSRYYYNYIKCIDVNIKSEIDSVYKDKLVDIFDNGITVWHYRQGNYRGVNNYDYENVEMSLMEVQNV